MQDREYLLKFQKNLEVIRDTFAVLPKQFVELQEIILLLGDLLNSSGDECSDFI